MAKDTCPQGRNAFGIELGSVLWPGGFSMDAPTLSQQLDLSFVCLSHTLSRIHLLTLVDNKLHVSQTSTSTIILEVDDTMQSHFFHF